MVTPCLVQSLSMSRMFLNCCYLFNQDGLTALYYAALSGPTAVVEVLMAAGADMNIKTTEVR